MVRRCLDGVGHTPDPRIPPANEGNAYSIEITRVTLLPVDAFLDTLASNPILAAAAIALVLLIGFSIAKKLLKLLVVTVVVFVALMAWSLYTGNDPGDPIRAVKKEVKKVEKVEK